jgi:TRAP transporter 4TM/12TM fusion protein
MKNQSNHRVIEVFFAGLCMIYVSVLLHYSISMWEATQRYGIIFLTLTLMLAPLALLRSENYLRFAGKYKNVIGIIFFVLPLISGIYFWVEYPSLVWERAGALNDLDFLFSIIFVALVIYFTWATSGHIIPTVTLVFVSYALFGHWMPGFFGHPPIPFTRFIEIIAGEMDGIFGILTQIGATWIAIFVFLAGFIQGFGGFDYVVRIMYQAVGKKNVGIPQVAVFSSMLLGTMSGSTAANAAGTGSFTIPTMKKFGMPPHHAASIEAIASSGGQIMPPILGAAAFVMCDYLGKNYVEIMYASIFGALIFYVSTSVSVHFIAQRYIDPQMDPANFLPKEYRNALSYQFIFQGFPIFVSLAALLIAFIVFEVNILLGGFFTILSFLSARLIYEAIAERGRISFLRKYLKGIYKGIELGSMMMLSIGAMLACLGIIVRVLTTTGLGEKISYIMINNFADNFALLLVLTMVICIIFGMAVSTVAAYILVVTLASPALVKLGVEPIAAHFAVFYWAMLSAFTPPVAAACVITASIAKASFMRTCWESMKLGLPKFIMPFIFITYPAILSFTIDGFMAFIIAGIGFIALSAGIQSAWGYGPRILMSILGIILIFVPMKNFTWIMVAVTVLLFLVFWRRFKGHMKKGEGL